MFVVFPFLPLAHLVGVYNEYYNNNNNVLCTFNGVQNSNMEGPKSVVVQICQILVGGLQTVSTVYVILPTYIQLQVHGRMHPDLFK